MKKSQSALEFLMTYGWAILAVVAAVGVLMYFDIIDLTDYVPETCVVNERSFSCLGKASMVGDTVAITIVNSNPDPVDVKVKAPLSGGCTTSFVCPKGNTSCETTTLPVNPGQEFTVVMKGCDPVEKFTGEVKVEYTDSSTGLISDFSVKVVAWNRGSSSGGGGFGDSTHMGCSNGACVALPGPGSNVCSADTDCYHMECLSNQCVRLNEPGPDNDTKSDTCTTNEQCAPAVPVYNLTFLGVSYYDKESRALALSFKNNGNYPVDVSPQAKFTHYPSEILTFPSSPIVDSIAVNQTKDVIITALLDDSIIVYTNSKSMTFNLSVSYGAVGGPLNNIITDVPYYDFFNQPGFKRDLQVTNVTGYGIPRPLNFTLRIKNIGPYKIGFRPGSIGDIYYTWSTQNPSCNDGEINPGEEKDVNCVRGWWSGGDASSPSEADVYLFYGRADLGYVYYEGPQMSVQMQPSPPFTMVP